LASLLLFLTLHLFFEDTIMKKVIIASLTAMFVLTGCNTFKGLGQDVSSAGNAVSGSAQEVQNKI
jgi:predicted small secreted protein